jgi:uncharacterized Zn-binding protein involved in type VI secretion
MSTRLKPAKWPPGIEEIMLQWSQQMEQVSQQSPDTATPVRLPAKWPRPGLRAGLLRHGDWIFGVDMHAVQLTFPPVPLLPICPIPFIGQVQVQGNPGKKAVYLNGKKVAVNGKAQVNSRLSHLGPVTLIPALSLLTLVGGSLQPTARIRPGRRQVKVNGRVVLTGSDSITSSCGSLPLSALSASPNVKTK